MEKERKAITLRVSPELKFQIEKAVLEDGDCTINSWLIKVIREYLEEKNREHRN
jgi:predicted HicB family RNase H-like nuclease